jgi:uridine kinase
MLWKKFRKIFHTMEKSGGNFPHCGKLFSTPWKTGPRMSPPRRPAPLNAASRKCFRQVLAWLEREAAAARAPLVVGLGGPGGSGKSTLARWLHHHLPDSRLVTLDDFRLPRPRRPAHGRYGSHPEANDLPRLQKTLAAFRRGRPIRQPVFDSAAGRATRAIELPPARLLLADGEIAAHAAVRPWLDRLILVEAHWRTQLNARLTRDLCERHCPLDKAIDLFLHSNLRDYPRFSAGAREAAQAILYCNARRVYSLRRLPVY